MNLTEIKDWLVPISTSFGIITVAVGVWMSLREYRLKLKAEARLEKSAEVEANIRLLTLFSEFMKTANGRSGYATSEKAIEWFLSNQQPQEVSKSQGGLNNLNQQLEDLAILTLPVGSAAQDSTVAAIAVLAERHEILRDVAAQALDSLKFPRLSTVVDKYARRVEALRRSEKPSDLQHSSVETPNKEATRKRLAHYLERKFQEEPALADSLDEGGSLTLPAAVAGALERGEIEEIVTQVIAQFRSK
jgi:hypothetical protein